MTRKYFGTDGIRGRTNDSVLTPEIAMKAGMAAGRIFTRGQHRHRVVIGKDTRLSGYMIESALVSGFTAVGMDVFQFGPLPTPAVAMLTRSLRADIGVMITASHNPYHDNGIKFFGPDGQKLSDAVELQIEKLMDGGLEAGLATGNAIGRAKRVDDSQARYIEFAKRTLPRNLRLEGLRIVIDCAHGAAYKVAPDVLWELGADIVPMGVTPDGTNINSECGSTAPEAMCAKVREVRADFGIALDGDADRVVMADEEGRIIDGDQILALIAKSWSRSGTLKGGGVVGTVMSNQGLDRYLKGLGLGLARASVGDRYVLEEMKKGGFNVGGEQSGHIILSDFSTTGDGLVAALQVLAVLADEGKPASQAAHLYEPLPQVLENVRFRKGAPLEDARVKSSIDDANAKLGSSGRILVRKSGTEPLIRVMAEGDDENLVRAVVRQIAAAIEEVAAEMPGPRLLVIAGSDSSAGAGLQADLKTAQAFGVYAQTAVTAVTVQDTEGVHAVHLMPPELVRLQIEAALGDIGCDAIKIGMLGNGRIAHAVAEALLTVTVPIVLDPVLVSSSGVPLLDEPGIAILKTQLIPRAMLVTPNMPETEFLTGILPRSPHTLRNAAQAFVMMGAQNILIKGGHGAGEAVRDVLISAGREATFESPRQETMHTHGTGCTLSTAIACGLALNLSLQDAVARAHTYVQHAIRTAPELGAGHGPLNHRIA